MHRALLTPFQVLWCTRLAGESWRHDELRTRNGRGPSHRDAKGEDAGASEYLHGDLESR